MWRLWGEPAEKEQNNDGTVAKMHKEVAHT